jgi:N-acetyl-gamma-glutamyl-phosphate reductase
MTRVAILGASGYTALELCRILLRHPHVEITALTTRQEERLSIGAVHPPLNRRLDLHVENLSAAEVGERAECAFSCLPHGASAKFVKELLRLGCRVVDFSADYRLRDAAAYTQWYGEQHADPERLPTCVYGLPELYRDRIRDAPLVANPGCYPTSAVLALAPLLGDRIVEPDGIIIDSKSGVSGAGRQPKAHLHFPECNESFAAYGVGEHRHTPEIDQVLSDAAGRSVNVVFTPHLVPMDRGILSTCYAKPCSDKLQAHDVLHALQAAYSDEPFVRVVEHLPATKHVAGSNFCDVTARIVRSTVVVISVIDNLIKGAAGAAVQNFNIMYEWGEKTALP